MNGARRIVYAGIVVLVVGVGLPVLDVAIKCERSRARILAVCPTPEADSLGTCPATSEACVWGKSLLPVSIGASLLLLGLPAALLVYWRAGRGRRAHP
jgi:hypothetical protein